MSDQRPKIYLKRQCPYCLKLHIFLTEAGLADRFELVAFDDGDSTHQQLRRRIEQAGQEPSFPAAELEPGKMTTGADELIARFAREGGVDADSLPLLRYYSQGVFPRHVAMFRELKELKEKQPA